MAKVYAQKSSSGGYINPRSGKVEQPAVRTISQQQAQFPIQNTSGNSGQPTRVISSSNDFTKLGSTKQILPTGIIDLQDRKSVV